MSAADSEAAIDRMAAKRQEMGGKDFAAYAFLALGILAHHSPDVVEFIFDRADNMLATPAHHERGDQRGEVL